MTALIAVASYRGVSAETHETIAKSGLPHLLVRGVSGCALARNVTLTRCEAAPTDIDTIVMMDDDMVIARDDLHALIATSKTEGKAVSARYITSARRLAASKICMFDPYERQLFVTGLGCLAIPRQLLIGLAGLEVVEGPHGAMSVYTWSHRGQFPGETEVKWISEDYRLCLRLGGVLLAPIRAGHVKSLTLWPEDE